MPETFSDLAQSARKMVQTLDWQTYHTPENLTLFLAGEASELGEYCQWLTKEEITRLGKSSAVEEEIADVIKSILFLANVVLPGISLETLVLRKLTLDAREYSVRKFRGKSRYYGHGKERRKGTARPIPTRDVKPAPTVSRLQTKAWKFVEDRRWETYYTPASLALAISVKSGEIATSYQRRLKPTKDPYKRCIWAMADVLINALRLCTLMGISDPYDMVLKKLRKDAGRFKR